MCQKSLYAKVWRISKFLTKSTAPFQHLLKVLRLRYAFQKSPGVGLRTRRIRRNSRQLVKRTSHAVGYGQKSRWNNPVHPSPSACWDWDGRQRSWCPCRQPSVYRKPHYARAYTVYISSKKHSPLHKACVFSWFSYVLSVKAWNLNPSHRRWRVVKGWKTEPSHRKSLKIRWEAVQTSLMVWILENPSLHT